MSAGKAVQHGIALAKRIGAGVTVLTVLPPFHTFTTDAQMIEDTPDQYKVCMQKHASLVAVWQQKTGNSERSRPTASAAGIKPRGARRDSRRRPLHLLA